MDPFSIILLAVAALLIFFMFRNNKKRQRDLADMKEKMVPGAEVMTNFGVFGHLISVDDEENQALIETHPGTFLRVHRQTIARVVEPTVDSPAEDADDLTTTTVADEVEAPKADPENPTRSSRDE